MSKSPRPFRLSFVLAAVTALALLLISELAHHRSIVALADTNDIYKERAALGRLLRYTVDAETGQRGFLLTGKDSYLKPTSEAGQGIAEVFGQLTRHYRENPAELAQYESLARDVERNLSLIAETIKLYREGRSEAWKALVESDIGKETQDRIRVKIFQLVDVENARLAGHEKQVVQTLMISRLGVATLTVLSLLAFYFYLRQARELIDQRERQRAELQRERDHLEAEVGRRTEDLTVLARNLQTTQEAERSHLAREMHDELGALFTSAKLDVARLQARMATGSPEIAERLKHLNMALNSGIELKRRIIEDLRPSSLGHFGLSVSLDILTREFAQRSGLPVDTKIASLQLGEAGDLTVYRFVQEALTNIAKYAKATRVEVRVEEHESGARIVVADDGVGFEPTLVRRSAHGITGMKFRVQAEGGHMSVKSQPGQGATLTAWLPTTPVAPAGDSGFGALGAAP